MWQSSLESPSEGTTAMTIQIGLWLQAQQKMGIQLTLEEHHGWFLRRVPLTTHREWPSRAVDQAGQDQPYLLNEMHHA